MDESMLLTDLAFPVTIVATDGLAEYTKAADDIRAWGTTGIRKYTQLGFVVADSKGSLWRMVRMEPQRKIRIWDRFRLIPVLVAT